MKKKNSAFTLIEILLALFLFSVAMTAIFSSFTSVLTNAKNIKGSIDDYGLARECFDRVEKDLKAVFVPVMPKQKNNPKPPPYAFVSNGDDGFSFTAFSHIAFADEIARQEKLAEEMQEILKDLKDNEEEKEKKAQQIKGKLSKLAIITYFLSKNNTNDDTYSLKRSDILLENNSQSLYDFITDDEAYSVCSNIKSMELIYMDNEGGEHSDWDSNSKSTNNAPPVAVEINLKLKGRFADKSFKSKIILPIHSSYDEK